MFFHKLGFIKVNECVVVCDFYRKIKTTRNSSGIRKVKLSLQPEVVSQNCYDQLLIMFHIGNFSSFYL